MTNICRLKEAGRKKYLSHNAFSYTVFFTTSFSQRLSQNVFRPTFFSQRLFHTEAFTYSSSQRSPKNVTLHAWYFCVVQISKNISINRSIWNVDAAHLPYIFCHCVKFQNPRTKTSYQSAADKVLYKYPKISQIPVISTILERSNWNLNVAHLHYISSIWEVPEPSGGFIPKCCGQGCIKF